MPDRLGFSDAERHLQEEDRITLTSVGIDIGSSTSHLVFSRLALERQDHRYAVVDRRILSESPVALTPYSNATHIDATALARLIADAYAAAGVTRDEVDAGALILTGMALQRENARAIGDLFAAEAGKFVSVSAGDHLETALAAHGSGAVALSLHTPGAVLNIDIGGGTTKLAVCRNGEVVDVAAADLGARLVAVDASGRVVRLEASGERATAALGLSVAMGMLLTVADRRRLAQWMADHVATLARLGTLPAETLGLLRTAPIAYDGPVTSVVFSGGVAEFIYGRETGDFGDLGQWLGEALRSRFPHLAPPPGAASGIRATVIGASQYTVQVSGSTIFISPAGSVPMRNMAVAAPEFPLDGLEVDAAAVRQAVERALVRLDVDQTDAPVAIAIRWRGSAGFARLHSLCSGIVAGMAQRLARGEPLVLVCDRDVAGLLGLHLKEELAIANPVVAVDGIQVRELDYLDIGTLLPASGAVPVVVKSLVFPPGTV